MKMSRKCKYKHINHGISNNPALPKLEEKKLYSSGTSKLPVAFFLQIEHLSLILSHIQIYSSSHKQKAPLLWSFIRYEVILFMFGFDIPKNKW